MGSWSGGMPDPLPPRLHCSKTLTCLIMINCCLDNQIQTQKVGDDSPRTCWERQGMCSLGKKQVPPPHRLTLVILSNPNKINSKIMWEDSPGRIFPAQTHFFSLFNSFSGSHLWQRCQFDDSEWLTAITSLHSLSLLFFLKFGTKKERGHFTTFPSTFAFQLKAVKIVNREIFNARSVHSHHIRNKPLQSRNNLVLPENVTLLSGGNGYVRWICTN